MPRVGFGVCIILSSQSLRMSGLFRYQLTEIISTSRGEPGVAIPSYVRSIPIYLQSNARDKSIICRNPFVCQVYSDTMAIIKRFQRTIGRNPFVCQVYSDQDALQEELDSIQTVAIPSYVRSIPIEESVEGSHSCWVAIPSYVRSIPIWLCRSDSVRVSC